MMAGAKAELTAWLSLDAVPGLGPTKAGRLLARHSATSLCKLSSLELSALGFSSAQAGALHFPDSKQLDTVWRWLDGPNRHLLTCVDPVYPEWLREIPAAPILLFVEGEPAVLQRAQIAMVGTRHPSPGGCASAAMLAKDLVDAGMVITSGLALGIDGVCHQAALKAGGRTIAVLGSGLACCYPRRHQALAQQIVAEGGALVSELWPDVAPRAENFPRRNRIISGLSLGTVVVEAAQQSGSLITARYALEQGREVFAVPGAIQNPHAAGCHHLIQQGAKLVCSAADILEEVDVHLGAGESRVHPSLLAYGGLPSSALLDNVGYEATAVDVIVQQSGQPVDAVLCELLELEMAGWITSVPGGYVRTRRD